MLAIITAVMERDVSTVDNVREAGCDEVTVCQEVLVVLFPNAVADPGAVVVKPRNALVAN